MKTRTPPKKETLAEWLLCQIEAFMDLNDMGADGVSFGWLIMRDGSLVSRLRDGKDVTTRGLETILSFMQRPVKYNGQLLNLKPLNIKRRTLP